MSRSVQDVPCGKGDDMLRGQDEVHAFLHELTDVEIPRVHKACGGDSKHIPRPKVFC